MYLFGIDAQGHKLSVIEHETDVAWAKLAPPHHLLSKYLPPVVVASPPLTVASLSIPVVFDRPNPTARVRASEFQDVLKKLQVSLWAEHRNRIAEALGVEPIDAVLVSFRVESVRVGGSEVLNPSELTGSPVELHVVVRFVARDTFERAREATRAPFFSDPAWMLVSGHGAPVPAVLLAQGNPTVLVGERAMKNDVHEIIRVPLNWSPSDVSREIEVRWGLSPKAATDLLAHHVAGQTGGSVRDSLDAALSGPRAALDSELRAMRVTGPLAVSSETAIPDTTAKGGVHLEPLDAQTMLRTTGLEFEGTADILALAAFAEFYYSERYSELNAWLRQRIAWLGTTSSA